MNNEFVAKKLSDLTHQHKIQACKRLPNMNPKERMQQANVINVKQCYQSQP